jgi:hypothetical protein
VQVLVSSCAALINTLQHLKRQEEQEEGGGAGGQKEDLFDDDYSVDRKELTRIIERTLDDLFRLGLVSSETSSSASSSSTWSAVDIASATKSIAQYLDFCTGIVISK